LECSSRTSLLIRLDSSFLDSKRKKIDLLFIRRRAHALTLELYEGKGKEGGGKIECHFTAGTRKGKAAATIFRRIEFS
jgi:hypothetical protein